MTRRILSIVVAAAVLLTLPSAATAAPDAPTAADRSPDDASLVTSADQPDPRLSTRQIRRGLPRPNAFGRGTSRQFQNGDFVTLCGAGSLAGPAPVAAAGARYDRGSIISFMGIEEHRSVASAKQRFNAAKRQIRRDCDGRVISGIRQDLKRTTPIRRIGQQNWVRGYAVRDLGSGQVIGEYLVHAYRIGRFVVFADLIGGSNVDPTVARRPLQRPWRQLGTGVRRL